MKITTHVLDTARGVPAKGIAISLYRIDDRERVPLGNATTNADGRTDAPLAETLGAACYELTFGVSTYFATQGTVAFYDEITVRFLIDDPNQNYHVPLLLSPWGYSTYRGS
jgi:5-hydroxyisourate hydrolase